MNQSSPTTGASSAAPSAAAKVLLPDPAGPSTPTRRMPATGSAASTPSRASWTKAGSGPGMRSIVAGPGFSGKLSRPGHSNPGLQYSPLRAASRREAFCGPALCLLCAALRRTRSARRARAPGFAGFVLCAAAPAAHPFRRPRASAGLRWVCLVRRRLCRARPFRRQRESAGLRWVCLALCRPLRKAPALSEAAGDVVLGGLHGRVREDRRGVVVLDELARLAGARDVEERGRVGDARRPAACCGSRSRSCTRS